MPREGFEPSTSRMRHGAYWKRTASIGIYAASPTISCMDCFKLHSNSDSKHELIRAWVSNLEQKEISDKRVSDYGFSKESKSCWLRQQRPVPIVVLENVNSSRITGLCVRAGKNICKPPALTPELAYLAGVILGDGHVKNYLHPTGYPQHVIIIEKMRTPYTESYLPQLIKAVFGIRPRVYTHKRKSELVRISVASKIICRVFTKLLGFSVGKKDDAPVIIAEKWPDELKLQFLAGLFDTDGGKSGNSYSLGNTSRRMIDFAKRLLEKNHIKTRIYTQTFPTSDYWHLYVTQESKTAFQKLVPVRNRRKFV